jgi:nascent polypeptide-associated complex subunit beta
MTKFTLLSTILFLVPFATCHFELKYPPSRAGDDSEKQGTFPCGGYDTVKDRTQFPLSDGSIQLELGHDRSLVQVLLALGNEPGDSFNIVWKPIVQQEGPGEFCLQDLVPSLLLSFFSPPIFLISYSGDINGRLRQFTYRMCRPLSTSKMGKTQQSR